MRKLPLIIMAALLGACSAPPPATPALNAPAGEVSAVPPADVAVAPAGTQPAAPETPPAALPADQPPAAAATTTITGRVYVPTNYQAGQPPARRQLLALDGAQMPAAGSQITVTNAAGERLGITTTTDAQGRYVLTLTLEVAGQPLIIQAQVVDKNGRKVTLQTITRPNANSDSTADLDIASSLVTSQALVDGLLGDFAQATFDDVVKRLAQALTVDAVGRLDLTNPAALLNELARIVRQNAALQQAFGIFGEGDPRSHIQRGGNNDNGPVVILDGQVK